jgi:hypothetical protein
LYKKERKKEIRKENEADIRTNEERRERKGLSSL